MQDQVRGQQAETEIQCSVGDRPLTPQPGAAQLVELGVMPDTAVWWPERRWERLTAWWYEGERAGLLRAVHLPPAGVSSCLDLS